MAGTVLRHRLDPAPDPNVDRVDGHTEHRDQVVRCPGQELVVGGRQGRFVAEPTERQPQQRDVAALTPFARRQCDRLGMR
ncbi:Uncharacterised protein [Mycobacterium tuberculosis]|uniref:Uncharacterized protein n=1 Tax=Mycobacterium tuberculosis TaxID=1773 RepID=A0A0U0UC32_MYCTX|nr:Uncharacterised protein [Mycobacterium tuberculosis]COX73963.1 Uncharacterised protein [Mycobacterium tuberculosis]COY95901.1 Uncharacterised protein [Mycobacterium tuberculosis]COZ81572.1 Uncharacterised protein [Mycobacterium tuberculosis]CPA40977.1 Uncharacterised protein [Mycobacterium tuberculosis]